MIDTDRLGRYVKPFVAIHIFSALGWLFLFSYQSWLVLKGQIERHKNNLKIGSALVIITTVFSIIITYQWGSTQRFIGESRDVLCFSALFFASVWTAKKGKYDTHKRLMLMALLNLIIPATTRIKFLFGFSDQYFVLVPLFIWIVIPIGFDVITIRKVHKATIFGIIFTYITFILMIVTVLSPIMEDINRFLYPTK